MVVGFSSGKTNSPVRKSFLPLAKSNTVISDSMPYDKQWNSSAINGMSPSGLPTKTGHVSSDSPNLDLANFSLPKLTSLGTKYVKEEVSRGGSSVHLQVKLHGKDVGQTMELRHGPEVKKDN